MKREELIPTIDLLSHVPEAVEDWQKRAKESLDFLYRTKKEEKQDARQTWK